MTFVCKIELDDYRRAAWLHVKPRRLFAVLGVLFLGVLLVVFLFTTFDFFRTGQDLSHVITMAVGIAYFTLAAFWYRWRVTRNYRQTKLIHQPTTYETTDSHLIAKAAYGESKIPWEAFHKWKADSRLILLYQSDQLFHAFPRRAFATADDYESFQHLLAAKLSRRN